MPTHTPRTTGKRGSGEGAIYKTSDGRWRASVDLGWRDGRRQRKYLSGRTRAEVAHKLRRVLEDQDAGVTLDTRRTPTLGEWMQYWLTNSAAPRVRPSTLVTYRGYTANRIVPELGHHRLDKLRAEDIEVFYARLTRDGLAPRTVTQIHRILHRALKVAEQRGHVRRNVASLVSPPSIPPREVTPLTPEQARAVLSTAEDTRLEARWSLALALGMRQGELLGLRWECVDLDAATLAVRFALQRRTGHGLVLGPPKSRAGRRVLPIPEPVLKQLLRRRDLQDAERAAAGELWTETGLVFTTPYGTPIDPRNDYRNWQQLLKDAGVPATALHNARHTTATVLLSQHVPARVVMELLGHSQIALTLGTYSHVLPEVAREASDRVGRTLWVAKED